MTLVYRLIDEESQRQSVSRLCRALGVACSGFYEWQRSPVSDREIADWLLAEQIRGIFEGSGETYGSPRVPATSSTGSRPGTTAAADTQASA